MLTPPNPSRMDVILMYAGRLMGTIAVVSILISLHYGDGSNGSTKYVADTVGRVAVLSYFALLIPYGMRYLGSSEGITGFSSQAKHVLKVLFMYMFLPAIIVTLIAVIIALAVTHPTR